MPDIGPPSLKLKLAVSTVAIVVFVSIALIWPYKKPVQQEEPTEAEIQDLL